MFKNLLKNEFKKTLRIKCIAFLLLCIIAWNIIVGLLLAKHLTAEDNLLCIPELELNIISVTDRIEKNQYLDEREYYRDTMLLEFYDKCKSGGYPENSWQYKLLENALEIRIAAIEQGIFDSTEEYEYLLSVLNQNDWKSYLSLILKNDPSDEVISIANFCIDNDIEPTVNNSTFYLFLKIEKLKSAGENTTIEQFFIENCPDKYNANNKNDIILILILLSSELLVAFVIYEIYSCENTASNSKIYEYSPCSHIKILLVKMLTSLIYSVCIGVISKFSALITCSFLLELSSKYIYLPLMGVLNIVGATSILSALLGLVIYIVMQLLLVTPAVIGHLDTVRSFS